MIKSKILIQNGFGQASFKVMCHVMISCNIVQGSLSLKELSVLLRIFFFKTSLHQNAATGMHPKLF